MTLADYLASQNITAVDFAARIGLSAASLTRIKHGEQNISRAVIRRIVEASDGLISADDLVFGSDIPDSLRASDGGHTPPSSVPSPDKSGENIGAEA